MKVFVWILISFYLLVTVSWIANSPYLISWWGVSIWFISIVLGFIAYKQLKASTILKKIILYSSAFMVFLVLVTGLIQLAVTSMP